MKQKFQANFEVTESLFFVMDMLYTHEYSASANKMALPPTHQICCLKKTKTKS